ncbi:MAG: hypothetical protein Q9203_001100 [Teloschistes exilis]
MDDASVLRIFQTFVLGLFKPCLQRILTLYPLSDPNTSLVRMKKQRRSITAQYRSIVTCGSPAPSSTLHGSTQGMAIPNVRLYSMDQTKYEPILKYMNVLQWRVCHLSDIPYRLNEDVAASGDYSRDQRELSAMLSGGAAAFAHTGNPSSSNGYVFEDWPVAYPDRSKQTLPRNSLCGMDIYSIGGPKGSGPVHIASGGRSDGSGERENALAWEKLCERCSFVNSFHEENRCLKTELGNHFKIIKASDR